MGEEIIDETIITEKVLVKCDKCNNDGTISTITLRFSKNPTEVVSIWNCKTCNVTDRLCMEDMKKCDKSVKVTAKLDSTEELSRYILFPKGAVANFHDMKENLLYSLTRPKDVVTTIGNLIEVKMEFIADCGCISDSKIDNSMCTHASQICENSTLGKNIVVMKESMRDPKMVMVIDDPSGNCRIGKPNRKFPESLYLDDLNLYNDDKVHHEFTEKKTEEY